MGAPAEARRGPGGGLGPNEACIRTSCPSCKQPATVWLWLEQAKSEDGRPRGMRLTGVVTDLVHDDLADSFVCAGPL